MKKDEMRKYLKLYPRMREAFERGERGAECSRSGGKKMPNPKPWVQKLPGLIGEILAGEQDETVRSLIEQSVLRGRKTYEIVNSLPLSERTYYRWKAKFEEKLYELLILSGEVSREEILSERIDS